MVEHSNEHRLSEHDRLELIKSIPRLKRLKWDPNDIQFLFQTMYGCALRVDEALRVRRNHFDIKNKILKIPYAKGGLNETVPYGFAYNELVLDWLNRYPHEPSRLILEPKPSRQTIYRWLLSLGEMLDIKPFVGIRQGKPIHDTVTVRWCEICNTAHCRKKGHGETKIEREVQIRSGSTGSGEKAVTHIFRKSAAHDMMDNGMKLNVISRVLRHKNVAVTQHYLGLNDKEVGEAWSQTDLSF